MGALVRLPVSNAVNQVFGANPTRNLPWNNPTIQQFGNYQPYGHDGVDFLSPMNTPVYAAGSGTLDFAGHAVNMPRHVALKWGFFTDPAMNWGGGIITMIDHGGFGTFYAHKNRSDWDHRVGQHVPAGALIGLTGTTGRSGGPHLHWSVVDFPLNYSDPLYSRRNPFDYITGEWFDKVDGGKGSPSTPKPAPKPKPKEWDEMATKNDLKAAMREVLHEPATLDKIALAILKRDCYLVDPSGKTMKITGKTNLATKVNYMAHNDAQALGVLVRIAKELNVHVDEFREAHGPATDESVPELTPTEDQEPKS